LKEQKIQFFESKPLVDYPVYEKDENVSPEGLPTPVEHQSGKVAGVEGNHSSQEKSVADISDLKFEIGGNYSQPYEAEAEGAQWNDDEDANASQGHLDPGASGEVDWQLPNDGDTDTSPDPNLSGPHPTEQLHNWEAGPLSGWHENDDYLEFTFDTGCVAESRLVQGFAVHTGYPLHDHDYDDNGGIPTPPMHDFTPETEFEFGFDTTKPQGDFGNAESEVSGIRVEPIIRRM
jgi:hypothetical protein